MQADIERIQYGNQEALATGAVLVSEALAPKLTIHASGERLSVTMA